MATNGESKFPYLFIALGLGAVGALVCALLARKETRELLRERGNKSLDYLNQQAGKLRETADDLVQQGKKLLDGHGRDSGESATESEK